MNVMSSIVFPGSNQCIQNRRQGLTILGLSATVPSSFSTAWLTASNSIATSTLRLEQFGPAPTLQYLTLGTTEIANAQGSLTTSSIQGNVFVTERADTLAAGATQTLTTQGIQLNGLFSSGVTSISFTGGVYTVPTYWTLSSIGTRGTLYAPGTTLSTITTFTSGGGANALTTRTAAMADLITGTMDATGEIYMAGMSSASLRGVRMNLSRGVVYGTTVQTTREVHCSSIVTNHISTGAAMRFSGPVAARLQETYISSLNSGVVVTSSLTASHIAAGLPGTYSTINPSTPWLETSSLNGTMNTGTDPFMVTHGLGTYFHQASIVADKTQKTYYSIVNPEAQAEQFLSSPYITTVAGTGTPGEIVNGQVATAATLGAALSPAATDAQGIFIGVKELGWKIQQIGTTGLISTIAGTYRYFYGDGQYPLSAALGPRLAVSVSPTSEVVITDSSNVRIRILTPDPVITTIAGTGVASYSGDGGLAYTATFSSPTATATDTTGALYIADSSNNIVRRITGSTIATYAGTPGLAGSTGDGGPATAARLSEPFGLAIDASNRVYVSDRTNCSIRSIGGDGVIRRVAGTYSSGYGGDGGPAVAAILSSPRGIAVDANSNIYFCDTGNGRVRRIDASASTIRTIAGNGTQAYGGDGGLAVNASLSTPTGVAVDGGGNVYIADTDNQCIRFVNMTTNRITTVAGRPGRQGYGGDTSFATFALLNSPSHIAFDRNSGYYYIADEGNCRIRYVDTSMRIIYSVAGNGSPLYAGDGGPATAAVFGRITSLARQGSSLYVVDDLAHTIRVIDLSTTLISAVAGTGIPGFSGDGSLATLAQLSSPQTVLVDAAANLYFTDRDNQRVRQITGGIISTVVGTGVGGYTGEGSPGISTLLSSPTALAIDTAGTLYVADLDNRRIRSVGTDPLRTVVNYVGNGGYGSPQSGQNFASTVLGSTTSLAVDSESNLCFTDVTTNAVWKCNRVTSTLQALSRTSSVGTYLGDGGPLSNAYFDTPTGITFDALGNAVISDEGNYRLRRSYTFGRPQIPVYLSLAMTYTNYFVSTGTAYISLNGNRLTTFYGSNQSNGSYRLTDANIYTYPLMGSNPLYNDDTPYVEIGVTDSYGYTKLEGNLFVQQVPSQGLQENSATAGSGIVMNSGSLIFPSRRNGITIENRFNDVSTRNVLYTGQLLSASDPALKEKIEDADTAICYSTLSGIPLKRYMYCDAYTSTFRVHDTHRLGFLTTDVAQVFPRSVQPMQSEMLVTEGMNTIDTGQIKYAHYGGTQRLQATISSLEAEVDHLMRSILAQRNTVL
jgi:sugar lactone lactonase YvrE